MSIPFLDLTRQYARIRQEVEESVLRVMESGVYIGGEEVSLFEEEAASYSSVSHGISLSSGTDALLVSLMALGVGVSLSNAKALLEAWLGKRSGFVRTPKYGAGDAMYAANRRDDAKAKRKRNLLPYLELAFGVYMACCTVYTIVNPGCIMAGPFFATFAVGFFYVSILTLRTRRAEATDLAGHAPAAAGDRAGEP